MTDPAKQPGFHFKSIRLLRAQYEVLSEASEAREARLGLGYKDRVDCDGTTVTVTQTVNVRLADPLDFENVYVRAMVVLEGRFEGSEEANFAAEDFGHNHAPAILFAFTREWVHRLTSGADPWPPILIPPLNVLEMRKRGEV